MKKIFLFLSVILLSSLKAMADEPYALLSDNNTKLTFYYGTKPANGMSVGPFSSFSDRGWNNASNTITTVEFDASMDYCSKITSTAYWFYNLVNLNTITGIGNLNTEHVTDMSYMFYWCSKLTSLNLRGFDTGDVTSMKYMFSGCSGLTSLDVSRFNTRNVEDMSYMFSNCSRLTSLDVSRFDTGKVTKMTSMFSYCTSLTSLDVRDFDTSEVTEMWYMFNNCFALKTIYCDKSWETVLNSDDMFLNCTKLVGGDGTTYSADHVSALYAHPNAGGYFTKEPIPYAVLSGSYNDKTLTFYYSFKPNNGMRVGPFESIDERGWEYLRERITTVEFDISMTDCSTITSTAYWFAGFANLKTIKHLEYLNTENVTDMSNMFIGCSSLSSIDMSRFDTHNVTDMSGMFSHCESLSSIDVSNFDTYNVTDMSGMFYGCSSLSSIDLSDFDTHNVTNMSYLFGYCTSLTSIDISSFDTSRVENMEALFLGCNSLTELDLVNLNTTAVTDMSDMFYDCSSLKTIYCYDTWPPTTKSRDMFYGCTSLIGGDGTTFDADHVKAAYAHPNAGGYFSKKTYTLLSNSNKTLTFYYGVKPADGMDVGPFTSGIDQGWSSAATTITTVVFDESMANRKNITSIAYWFYNLNNLTTITGIENLYTEHVRDMSYLFSYCSSLTSIDLSSWDTRSVENMEGVFLGCTGLTVLDLDNLNTTAVTNMAGMFFNCSNLKTICCNDTWNSETESDFMFTGCTSLVGGEGTRYSADHVSASYAHPDAGGYFTRKPVPYAVLSGSYNDRTLTFYYGPKPHNSMRVGPFESAKERGWEYAREKITTVEFDISMTDCSTITSTAYWFAGFINLKTIKHLDYLNTENVTDMSNMFIGCSSLSSIDMSRFDTHNVTDMSYMFVGCQSLSSIDVSNFDTYNVTDMSGMFRVCHSLSSINISNFDTHNVTNMMYLFGDCPSLTSIDISSFDTSRVENMEGLFIGCNSLTELDLVNLNTTAVTDMSDMFYDCSSLKTIYCYDTWTPTTKSRDMFTGCTSLVGGDGTTYDAAHVKAAYAHPNAGGYFSKKAYALLSNSNKTLTFYYGVKPADGMDVGPFTSDTDQGWSSAATTITTVVFDESMANCKNITSTAYWFFGLEKLTTITGIENLQMENVTDMSYLFGHCSSLTSIDFSSCDTRRVENMEGLFLECTGLTEIDLNNLNTTAVTNMAGMFFNCSNLKTILCDNTWNPETASNYMFQNCTSLVGGDGTPFNAFCITAAFAHPNTGGYFTKKPEPYAVLSGSNNNRTLTFYYGAKPDNGLDVGPFESAEERGWDDEWDIITTVEFHSSMASCSTITSTAKWFTGLKKLNTIKHLEYLQTENVTNMSSMFYGCSSLTSIDLSDFDTHNVTNMSYLFGSCSSLTSIDISSCDTRNVKNMGGLFIGCNSLTELDLVNLNTTAATDMSYMFCDCSKLKTIYCSDTWNSTTPSQDMFSGCTSLVGGTGTTYNSQNVNAAYAHPNAGGYFTKKGLLGDVNDDGKVTPADAIMILYHYFGVAQTGFNESVADVNGDKKISPADAIEALYIYFGSSSGGNARATRPATVSIREPE